MDEDSQEAYRRGYNGAEIASYNLTPHEQQAYNRGKEESNAAFAATMAAYFSYGDNTGSSGNIFGNASNASGIPNSPHDSRPFLIHFSHGDLPKTLAVPTLISPLLGLIITRTLFTNPDVLSALPSSYIAFGLILGVPALFSGAWAVHDLNRLNPEFSKLSFSERIGDTVKTSAVGMCWGAAGGFVGMFGHFYMASAMMGIATTQSQTAIKAISPMEQPVPQRQTPSHHKALLSVAPC